MDIAKYLMETARPCKHCGKMPKFFMGPWNPDTTKSFNVFCPECLATGEYTHPSEYTPDKGEMEIKRAVASWNEIMTPEEEKAAAVQKEPPTGGSVLDEEMEAGPVMEPCNRVKIVKASTPEALQDQVNQILRETKMAVDIKYQVAVVHEYRGGAIIKETKEYTALIWY